MPDHPRVPFDLDAYERRVRDDSASGACFICSIVAGTRDDHLVVYRDEVCIAFLAKFPTLAGYTLVAPLEHRTDVVGSFTEDEYADLQRRVHRIGRAVSSSTPTERLYVLSLGSHQGNAHVHWHVAPLPPGVPYREQQYAALMHEHGHLEISEAELSAIARRIGSSVSNDPFGTVSAVAAGPTVLMWHEVGDRQGPAVVYFHGTESTEHTIPFPDVARRLGVRVLMADRPGYGGSKPMPDASLSDVGRIVLADLDRQGVSRFSVVGWSGGGPHALACAALASRRVGFVGLLGSWASMNPPDPALPTGVRIGMWAAASLPRSAVRALFLLGRQSSVGMVDDVRRVTRPWQFDIGEVTSAARVCAWHHEHDRQVPVAPWRGVEGIELTVLPGDSHDVSVETWTEVLRVATDAAVAVEICDAVLDDMAVLGDVFRRSSLSNEGDRPNLLEHPEVLELSDLAVRQGRTRVAMADDRIVGFASVAEGAAVEVEDLFVDPAWMRRGVGLALVRDIVTTARREGHRRVGVIANEHALAFYRTAGFVDDGTAETRFGPARHMHLDV